MAVRMDATTVADKWSRRLKGASQDIKNGVNAVTTSPGALAVKKQDKLRQNFIDAVDSGKWARRTGSLDLNDWKDAVINKGLSRLSSGVDGAMSKVTSFLQDFLPFVYNQADKVNQMPDVTFDDSINRMVAMATAMHNYQRK